MDQIELKVTKREILGKKVRFLRRQGITPTNVFGHGIESLALQCDTAELRQVLAGAGQTRLISLTFDKGKRPRTVVVREIQKETLTDELLHVNFYQVKMAEVMKVEVPVVLVGESPALKSNENVLMQEFNTLTVECLPGKIPTTIEMDISSLAERDQALYVKDIELGKDINVLHDPELMILKIKAQPIRKIEEVVEEKAEVIEAPEAAEGAPLPEGEKKAEE